LTICHVENRKRTRSTPISFALPRWAKKIGELWSTNKIVLGLILTNPKCAFTVSWRNFVRHVVLGYGFRSHSPWRCCERNFSYPNRPSSRTCGVGRPHVWLCPQFPVLYNILHSLYNVLCLFCNMQRVPKSDNEVLILR